MSGSTYHFRFSLRAARRYIDAGDLRIAFYLKAPIYLVAVSDWCEPESLVSVGDYRLERYAQRTPSLL